VEHGYRFARRRSAGIRMLPPETTGVMAARAEIAAMIAVLDMMKGYLLGLTSRTSEAIRFLHV